MNVEEMKKVALGFADDARAEIIGDADELLNMPELGYKEFKTSKYIEDRLRDLGVDCEAGLAVTGVKGVLRGRSRRPAICVIGEMDAVVAPSHPNADKSTGAAHACGHNVSSAAMLGVAAALIKSDLMRQLDGDVVFFAVPAEEFVELEYRKSLREKGAIKYYSGKQELIRIGAFDSTDVAMMTHSCAGNPDAAIWLGLDSLGFTAKVIHFIGKEAHAVAPDQGINALNAAMAALMCIHAQRETFRDEDKVRIHPIITKGGDLVNVIPADVTMETYVRALTSAAIADASRKVDRAIEGACYAIGADFKIENIPGYLPLTEDIALGDIFLANILRILPECPIHRGGTMAGSTDIGDLSGLIPCIQPLAGGFEGTAHGTTFRAVDYNAALMLPVKAMLATIIDLLSDGAQKALEIKKNFKPAYTRKQYLKYLSGSGGGLL